MQEGVDNIKIGHSFNGLITDEQKFSLQPDFGRLLIWREHEHDTILQHYRRDHYAGGGLMTWEGIMQDTRTAHSLCV